MFLCSFIPFDGDDKDRQPRRSHWIDVYLSRLYRRPNRLPFSQPEIRRGRLRDLGNYPNGSRDGHPHPLALVVQPVDPPLPDVAGSPLGPESVERDRTRVHGGVHRARPRVRHHQLGPAVQNYRPAGSLPPEEIQAYQGGNVVRARPFTKLSRRAGLYDTALLEND